MARLQGGRIPAPLDAREVLAADDAHIGFGQQRVQALTRSSRCLIPLRPPVPDLVRGVHAVEGVSPGRLHARDRRTTFAQELRHQRRGHAEPEVDDLQAAKTVTRLLHTLCPTLITTVW